jgi:cellulose biosynthesis protein BcsQ
MTQILTLYNHKGGVSKTTTTYHLAHALTESQGKKVLVVDADPQCNLTELLLFGILEELDDLEGQGKTTVLPGTTVKDALWPRLEGDRPSVDVDAIQLVKPSPSEELYVFRGDIALSEAEDRLSYAHSQRLTTDLHQKRNYVAVHDMLRRLGDRDKFDVILVDVGPSAGALTRSFFMACDRFLVPVAPDRFNFQAIASLSAILQKWIAEHSVVIKDFVKLGLNVPQKTPQLLGLIMQRFQRHRGTAKPSFKLWIDRIKERASQELVPGLVAAAGANAVAKSCLTNPIAVEIPDFASLAPMMLSVGKPVWRLTQPDTGWQGNVWDDRKKAMKEVQALFFDLAAAVV